MAITMVLLLFASSCGGGLVRKVTTARTGFPRQPDVGIAVFPLISRIKEQMRLVEEVLCGAI